MGASLHIVSVQYFRAFCSSVFPFTVGMGQWMTDYIFLYCFSSNLKLQEFIRYINLKLQKPFHLDCSILLK